MEENDISTRTPNRRVGGVVLDQSIQDISRIITNKSAINQNSIVHQHHAGDSETMDFDPFMEHQRSMMQRLDEVTGNLNGESLDDF